MFKYIRKIVTQAVKCRKNKVQKNLQDIYIYECQKKGIEAMNQSYKLNKQI